MPVRFTPAFYWITSFAGWLIVGCQPPTGAPFSAGYDYFPLQPGQYRIYDVTEHRYALTSAPVTRTYQLREVTGLAYTDAAGQVAYQLHRYRRDSETAPWQPDSIWSARLVNNEAIRTENGRDFIKLMFPPGDLLTWNGNRRNGSEPDELMLRNSGQPYRVQDKEFGETVTVLAQTDSTLISKKKRIEVYARQVGLVYAEQTRLYFCTSSPDCIGKNQIDYGIQQVYSIRSFGID
ncbi:hypothetical protein [Spirosoma sordidisoli]|uniref:Uncharacterized protein n=1 Tax=Spirosoma sordidisoli TaxID=2502893 RepID=A0A4Q2UIR2_9BACT|nr:hypothetical protein [Spirosoma sordidisoli]RYC69337.1 hypothetical protein EQG79_12045 [Spirosoma sordidisoli]